jgi:protein gp37
MDDLRRELFATIDATPNLDWQLLTKRPQNIRRMWPCPLDTDGDGNCHVCSRGVSHRRENVWLITSVSDQATTDAMVPELLQCRDLSPVLGLSMEPLLGPVDLRRIKIPGESYELDALKGHLRGTITRDIRKCARLNWVIIGCESNGPKVGRLSIDGKASKADWIGWAIAIVEQCRAAGVAVFVKQIPLAGRVCHDINLFPAALRFREFPDRVLAG